MGTPVFDGLAPAKAPGRGAPRTDPRRGRAGVRPAADTCSGARSGPCARSRAGLHGLGGTEVTEDVLEAVVAQHRALETGRADLDAEQVEEIVGPDGRHLAVSVNLRRVQVWDLAEVRLRLREVGLDWQSP